MVTRLSPWPSGGEHQQAADQIRHQCWVQDSHTRDADLGTKLIDQTLEFPYRAFPCWKCRANQIWLLTRSPSHPPGQASSLSPTSSNGTSSFMHFPRCSTAPFLAVFKYNLVKHLQKQVRSNCQKGLGVGGVKEPWPGERRLRKDIPVNDGPSAAPGIFSFQKA